MHKISYIKLAGAIVICQLAGIIGSFFTSSSVSDWYPTLSKPAFNPPSWVFAPVWATIFLLMGVSLYLVWTSKKPKRTALILFYSQLVLNILWSVLFFGLRSPLFAAIEIVVLWAAILATMIYFNRISKPAAYLLLPYILWVSFAAILNMTIAMMN